MAIGTTAAIIGGAVVGAAGSAIAGSKAAGAAKDAAKVQANASQYAADLQYQQFQQTREDMAPWRNVGEQALYQYAQLLGVPVQQTGGQRSQGTNQGNGQGFLGNGRGQQIFGGFLNGGIGNGQLAANRGGARGFGNETRTPVGGQTGQAASGPDYSSFFQSPGYQFQLDEGINAAEKSAAARGLLSSGHTLRGITALGQGMAAQSYDTYANRLAALAGVGQTTSQQLGYLGQQAATNQGTAIQNGANATASGYLNSANAWGQAIGGIGQSIGFGLGAWSQMPQQQPTLAGGFGASSGGFTGGGYIN